MLWKCCGTAGPPRLLNTMTEYTVPPGARQEYENELCQWIKDSWLVPYDGSAHGSVMETIPLMAVVQLVKKKVRPVLDFVK